MRKFLVLTLLMIGSLSADVAKIGVVDFDLCATDSKVGKEESASFTSLQNKAMTDMQTMEKERQELAEKMKDQDYLDGLSPEAQQELHQKMQNQQMKMQLAGENYEKTLRQTYQQMEEKISSSAKTAAKHIRQDKKLDLILPLRFCLDSAPTLDITAEVIKKMDELIEKDQAGSKK